MSERVAGFIFQNSEKYGVSASEVLRRIFDDIVDGNISWNWKRSRIRKENGISMTSIVRFSRRHEEYFEYGAKRLNKKVPDFIRYALDKYIDALKEEKAG